MALLWLAGGGTTLLVVLLPHPAAMRDEVILVSATAPVVPLAIHPLRDRLPMWTYPGFLASGTGIVTTLVAASGGGSTAVSFSFFYTWVVVYAVLFFRPVVAALEIAVTAAAYGFVLWSMSSFGSGTLTAVEPTILAAVIATTSVVIMTLSHAREISELDVLTGIANRRGLDRLLEEAVDRLREEAAPLVLAVVDVDHFKQINDVDGHQAGDRLLRELVTRWRLVLRTDDIIARFGGDEFVLILPFVHVGGRRGDPRAAAQRGGRRHLLDRGHAVEGRTARQH